MIQANGLDFCSNAEACKHMLSVKKHQVLMSVTIFMSLEATHVIIKLPLGLMVVIASKLL